jgi:hypothetical protein
VGVSKRDMREIFANFEVNREPRWQIISQLMVASVIFHAMVLAFVFYVPGVRDSFNIAALLSKTKYVDRAYSKTEIGEGVRVIELAEKFHYPEGYFAMDVPPEASGKSVPDPFAPKVVFENKPEKAYELPAASPTPTPEPSPTLSPAAPTVSPETNAAVTTSSPTPDPKDPAKAEEQLNKVAAENNVVRPSEDEVNTRPLKDWLARANGLKEKGQLDLTAKVEITIAANLTSNCKLADAKVIQKSGDTRLLEVAKEMVAAIGDSGMLSFLRDPNKAQDSKELRCDEFPLQLSIKLDQNEISAQVESQADSPERAEQMARGYNGLLAIGQWQKRGHDEELLYKNTKVTAEGKQILVNFSMPRQTASEMLKKQLPAS